jgi:hypothetical protein
MSQKLSPFDFHHGEALLRVANHYPTLADVIYESVQNALDANARRIFIKIDFERRNAVISDDGDGVTREKFEMALTSVCCSIKENDRLGQFGMGLVSPLGKCEEFSFTSTPKANPHAYLCWRFNTKGIQQQEKIAGIPVEELIDLRFDREMKGRGGVPWRTMVEMKRFTRDRTISRLTNLTLQEGILERFSAVMRKNGVIVEIVIVNIGGKSEPLVKIVADQYEGRRLSIEYLSDKEAGQTSFKLYIARRTEQGRRGKVSVGETNNDFRISFSQFAKHPSAAGLLSEEVITGLTSGVFEGEILSQNIKLDPSRRHFVSNDALVGFCIAIEAWFSEIGKKHLSIIKEEQQDHRWQQLGLRSLRVIEELLSLKEFFHLKEVVEHFAIGSVGLHHTPTTGKREIQPIPSLSTKGGLSSQPVERNTARIVRVESTQDRSRSPACYPIMPF